MISGARPRGRARHSCAIRCMNCQERGVQRTARPTTALLHIYQFFQQLLLQMSPRSLFDRATFSGYALLLRLTFAPCSRFHRLRHVPDLGPMRTDVSLFWFRVRIHDCLALLVGNKNKRNRGVSRHNFIDRRFAVNK